MNIKSHPLTRWHFGLTLLEIIGCPRSTVCLFSSKTGSLRASGVIEIFPFEVQESFSSVFVCVCFTSLPLVGTIFWKTQNIFCLSGPFFFIWGLWLHCYTALKINMLFLFSSNHIAPISILKYVFHDACMRQLRLSLTKSIFLSLWEKRTFLQNLPDTHVLVSCLNPRAC